MKRLLLKGVTFLQVLGLVSSWTASSLIATPPLPHPSAAILHSSSSSSSQPTSDTSSSTRNDNNITPLSSILASQQTILDGAEYQTLQASLGRSITDNAATWTVVVGERESDKKRVVGVLASPNALYTDSVAELDTNQPPAALAISTMIHAVSLVHACLPPNDATLYKKQNWHVVIVGGGDLAQMARKALQQGFDVQTTLVTTRSGIPNSMEPAVGELELGFCQVIGNFNVLLDTVGDEFCNQKSSVVRLLQERHGCERYMSTRTRAQEIVSDNGILFGPNQAKDYINQMQGKQSLPEFVPPSGLGATVERLLQKGLVIKYPDGTPKQTYVRGWNLKKYWEVTTWPRDSAGGANIRFGFPVPDDLDGIEERFMINEPPARQAAVLVDDKEDVREEEESNPYIVSVVGVKGLQDEVIEPKRDVLLFLSAPFCRTCRYLNPQYQRMARLAADSSVTFAKANATGKVGKELGKSLDVDSVPTFLLFRQGRIFGKPLSISRLPSKKLQLAVNMLEQGLPWDEATLRAADAKKDEGK